MLNFIFDENLAIFEGAFPHSTPFDDIVKKISVALQTN